MPVKKLHPVGTVLEFMQFIPIAHTSPTGTVLYPTTRHKVTKFNLFSVVIFCNQFVEEADRLKRKA